MAIPTSLKPNLGGKTMQNLLPLILIGFVVYQIFFRKGGMGCCGGHGSHGPNRQPDADSLLDDHSRNDGMGKVIDLDKDEYTILPSRNDPNQRQT